MSSLPQIFRRIVDLVGVLVVIAGVGQAYLGDMINGAALLLIGVGVIVFPRTGMFRRLRQSEED